MIDSMLKAGSHPSLSSNNLKASAQATTAASVIIQNYVGTILSQPDLSLPDVLPNLPAHQKTAREHATGWRDTVQPKMISTNTDIVSFSNAFDSYFTPLLALAVKIQQNPSDSASINTFKTGIQQLQALVTAKQNATTAVITSVSGFQTDLAGDARNFNTDFNTAQSVLAGKDGQIAALGKQIDAINSAMSKDLTMIAAGSTAAVVGGLMIAVGALAEIATAGVSTALIVGGLVVVGAGAGVAIAGGVDYAKQTSALGDAISKKTTLQQQYAATKQVNSIVQGLSDQSSAAVKAAGALLAGWQTLGQDFMQFQTALNSSTPDLGFFLIAQLNAAKADWDDVAAQARKLLDYGTLTVSPSTVAHDGVLTINPTAAFARLAAA
ncbi:HBL/NHE enterotoxin family protein [Pseudomonas sp. NA-150]|uniref:HBL/NHE enterotoxin family protein n=1 Tax=Pseudomonas sp. NA-150 TaxID=3367525 RepID=UPI0037C8FB71